MRVLVADKFEQIGLDGLKDLGCEVLYQPDLSGPALTEALKETSAEVLVVRSTKVTATDIENSRLALIIRAGAGYNTIDVEAANGRGIFVSNCPGKNSVAVAELAFGLILSVDRRIPDNVQDIREGHWNKGKYSKARGLAGKTLGLIGLGKISQEMIPRAKAFGMNVIASSRWMSPDVAAALGIARAANLIELAQQADVVSVHVALSPDTKQMIGREFFEALKPGSIFVNTSRAEVVDQAVLEEFCRAGKIWAGLDVFNDEPAGKDGPFSGSIKDCPNVFCTHHIGASTEQAQTAIAHEVVRIVREFKYLGNVPNAVNVRQSDEATHLLVVRHYDHVGVLAFVLAVLKEEGVNVQEMENVVLAQSRSAIAQISLSKEVSPAGIQRLKNNPDVLDATLTPIEHVAGS